ncbi:uncharacterized protein LOC128680454 isoform X2 [Plodia interpunctella]|nr:uncharacterized protein LOC128680454 isoform X2 [Plodia interpunctella]
MKHKNGDVKISLNKKSTRNNIIYNVWRHNTSNWHAMHATNLKRLSRLQARRKGKSMKNQNGPLSSAEATSPNSGGATSNTNAANAFTRTSKTTYGWTRTTPKRVSFIESCEYDAYYCMKAYVTGSVCARTDYFLYMTFKNYCQLNYINCLLRYEVWHIIHMSPCMTHEYSEFVEYPNRQDYKYLYQEFAEAGKKK